MGSSVINSARARGSWAAILLSAFALWMLPAAPAQAEDCVADFGGVLDGNVNPVPPSQIQIDGNCTIRNFPASNPLTSNISWYGNNPTSWLLIFDNVVHTGNMACNLNSQGNKIWFVNSASTSVQAHCLSLLIPVEKIDKQTPAGQTTATIGVPFTYTLTMPVLFDPGTGTVINNQGSVNDLHGVTVWDDLNATGAALTYVSHRAYWKSSGAPVPHTFTNVGGQLTFDNFPIIPAGEQIVIELTLVLDDSPANVNGTQFVNTAKWDFGRLIGGVFYEPLPGEWGVSPPLTIAAPNLVMTKTGPATMNLFGPGTFALDVQNTGLSDAWNATILDRLPDGATGGMCDATPEVLSVTLAGNALTQGTQYSLGYIGAPTCELRLTLLDAAGPIRPNEHLIVTYRTTLDADTQNGATLTNVAGATQWFNGDSSVAGRRPYLRTLTDGTVGTLDHEDAHTVVAVYSVSITKEVAVVGGGAAVAGAQLEYLVRVSNFAVVPANYVVITDDLDLSAPGYLTYVDQSATLNASTVGISVAGPVITADYSTSHGPLQPGESILLRFRAVINPNLAIGTTVTNTGVVTWNDPPETAQASVSIDVGGMVGVGTLSGTVWHDANFDTTADLNERRLENWSVGLYRNGQLVRSTLTDASGAYLITGVAPNYLTAYTYELRFVAPGAGPNTAKLGRAHSIFTNDLQRITDIVVRPSSVLPDLNLPISPNGVVYDAIVRTPIAGATLTMLNAGSRTALPASCFYDPAQQNQVTLAAGYYRFDINFSDPSCPSDGAYLIDVTAPASGYIAGPSQLIPPISDASTGPFSVPACPGSANDAIPATAQYCEVQISEFAPAPSVPPRTTGTNYHLHLTLDDSQVPGSSQIFDNHIPIDPDLHGALAITKTTPLLNVTRGQLVPYTITFNNVTPVPLFDVHIVDSFPAGFSYVKGSARLDGVPTEPAVAGRVLTWTAPSIDGNGHGTLQLLLAVGAGVGEGEFVNRAQAVEGATGNALSGVATATVRVIPDATFDCTDVTGKVFADANRNGYQDEGEEGLAGVRLVTPRGLAATTDGHGRYHITCAITPHEGRGSNFILKLDDRTLPSGFRESTEPVRVQRATRGKALRINFGASIYRVVGLDIADPVFEPGATEMRGQWKPRMTLLLNELQKAPAVLRLSYLADVEDERLVERRVNAVKNEIMQAWKALDCCYRLTIEQEVFWRRGGPPEQDAVRVSTSR